MTRMNIDDLKASLSNTDLIDYEADKMAWAFVTKHDWPLPYYDEDTFDGRRNEGAPEAYLASSISHAIRWMRDRWTDAVVKVTLDAKDVMTATHLTVMGSRMGFENCLELPPERAGRGVALATISADELAEAFRQEIWARNLEATRKSVKPWAEWHVERHGDYFHAVDHENRLMGSGIDSADNAHAARHRTENLSVLLIMRKRYEEAFPDSDPELGNDNSGPGM